MITVFDPERIEPPRAGSVISVGVFDGVHLGHQATLLANRRRAGELGAVSAIVTFRRHPKRVLLGQAPRTLTPLEHRLELFERLGIELCVALQFDEALREMSAEDFTRGLLADRLRARAFVLGFDSKFGRDRRGGAELLRALGYAVDVVEPIQLDGYTVSSTAIREAVELGDLARAARMLGRPVSVLGLVVHGDARGRSIGFPTANLDLHHQLHPPFGVYAGWARVAEPGPPGSAPAWKACVANIGQRPTVNADPHAATAVEVHLLDFSGDLYGLRLELSFDARLRGELRFGSLEQLRAQIERDVQQARELLRGRRPQTSALLQG